MSTISNKFYVEALDDGSTLHAQLLSDKSLTQGYTAGGCVPDWTQAANQPVVYVDLINGTDRVAADSGGKWTYNGVEIDFTNDSRFEVVENFKPGGYTSAVPAMKIKGNLASSSNVDTDSIGYSGTYTVGGYGVPFAVSALVRITGVMSAGVFGLIEFADGSNVISTEGQVKTLFARLYGADGVEIDGSKFTTAWYVNDAGNTAGKDITAGGTTYKNAFQVEEGDVTDNAIIRCVMTYTDGGATHTYTAYESIDDQTDPEQMYIQSVVDGGAGGFDGGGMELRKGQRVQFRIWMGTMASSDRDTSWQAFYVRLHKSDGSVLLDNLSSDVNNVESMDEASADYGYRKLKTTGSGQSFYAYITFDWDMVRGTFDKYLTGYVKAVK